MNKLPTIINAVAFAALFAAYASGPQGERPHGVRRALQIYDAHVQTDACQRASYYSADAA